MLSNLHTHTTLCDGKNTPEEMVLAAIEKGFTSIGFSGHGYTDFDLSYCLKDTTDYLHTMRELRERYRSQIEIYIGLEEDAGCLLPNRSDFDYIIGSSHYVWIDDSYCPIDSGADRLKQCIELFDGDPLKLADCYYRAFCEYILTRKPDIIGHFDLITKYDELDVSQFLKLPAYQALAERYLKEALKSDCLFEVNTGAIGRGYRTSPYPSAELLHVLKKNGGKVILSSDCHAADKLDCFFAETRAMLRDIGFEYVYALSKGTFIKDYL